MAEEAKKAPEVEAKETETVEKKTEDKSEASEIKPEEVKAGDIEPKSDSKKEPKMVPEAALLEYKKEAKELAKELKEIKKLMEEGATKKEVSSDIKEIADEFGLEAGALNKLVSTIGEKTKAELEKEIENKLKPLSDEKNEKQAKATFDEHFEKLMEAMPEFKGIANKDVVRSLASDPRNANKTFAKILEDSYGHLIVGKKTLEKTQARGGNSDAPIDFSKAAKDPAYFNEIMASPELKKKYNDGLISRLKL